MDVNVYLARHMNLCTTGVYGSRRARSVFGEIPLFFAQNLSVLIYYFGESVYLFILER